MVIWKASEVKKIGCAFLKERKGIELKPEYVRLREKIADSLTRIYKEKKMREQQVIEKKMIAIEEIEAPEDYNTKDYLIYVKIWDQMTWNLSEGFELLVSKTDSGYDLSQKIYTATSSILVHNLFIKYLE